MANICPSCERAIVDGEHVRMQVLAVYHKAPIPNSHGIDVYEEEWMEHLLCGNHE